MTVPVRASWRPQLPLFLSAKLAAPHEPDCRRLEGFAGLWALEQSFEDHHVTSLSLAKCVTAFAQCPPGWQQ